MSICIILEKEVIGVFNALCGVKDVNSGDNEKNVKIILITISCLRLWKWCFNYLGCSLIYDCERVVYIKQSKYRLTVETFHWKIRNETQKETTFYKLVVFLVHLRG